MRALALILVLASLLSASAAQAQFSSLAMPATTQDIAASRPVLPGTYTVATLPDPVANQAKYAFVTDLGGGADMVLSDGAFWKRIRRGGLVVLTAISQSVDILRTGSILALPSGTLSGAVQLSIATGTLYPGAELTVVNAGILGVGASLGVGLGNAPGAAFLPVLGQKWVDYVFDGTALRVVRTGGLI